MNNCSQLQGFGHIEVRKSVIGTREFWLLTAFEFGKQPLS